MRLIDADALMERFAEMQKMGKTDGTEYACNFMSAGQEPSAEWYTIEDAVDNAPTVDAVPVVRGRWVHSPDTGTTICTACGWIIEECFYDASTNKDYPFCPNCGADMREPNLDTTKGERRDESSG